MAWDGLDAVNGDKENIFYGLKFSAHTKDYEKKVRLKCFISRWKT